jgi:lysozyme family protein
VLRTGLMTMAVVMALGVAGAGVAVGQTLSQGDRGSTVVQLQKKLGIAADGVYGPQTRAAVRRFQRRRGLTVDGVAGPQTLAALGIAAPRDRASSRTRIPAALERIAECESGGNPRAIGGGGRYRGKYQFTYETWRAVGGTGDPAAAPESEQDRRAAILYRREGSAPWPSCG